MYLKIMIFISFIWAGMILGISFLESWVKFSAPLLTLPIGLDVGRTVFGAFHKVQLVLLICFVLVSFKIQLNFLKICFIFGLIALILMQMFYLLPILNHRADSIINGHPLNPSYVHAFYGITEILKLMILIASGFLYLSKQNK